MKNATDEVLSHLKEQGYRVTEARKKIIDVLARQQQPITIQNLCLLVSGVDTVSVYRTVSVLQREHLLEEIVVPGEGARFALSHGHHHHAICTSCGTMEHIECETKHLRVPSGFKSIKSHEVTLYGLCKKCA
jgi:Fe2+ or Zn2+ uptake regulation protein